MKVPAEAWEVQSMEAAAGHLADALCAPEPPVRRTAYRLVAESLGPRPLLAAALATAIVRHATVTLSLGEEHKH